MLTIRQVQMEAFRSMSTDLFEKRAFAHLRKVFETRADELGEAELRNLIRAGLMRAGALGIHSETNVLLYIDLLLALGADFESRSEFEWASELVRDNTRSETLRLELVYDQLPSRVPPVPVADGLIQ